MQYPLPTLRTLSGCLCLLMPASQAAAAGAAPRTPAPAAVFVSDFSEPAGAATGGLGRLAAARLSAELSGRDPAAVVPDARVQERMHALRLRGPCGSRERARVGAELGAGGAVFGTITSLRFTEGPAPSAAVRMLVLVEEVKTGRLLHGASVEGVSAPGDGPGREQLAAAAVACAARRFADYAGAARGPDGCGAGEAPPCGMVAGAASVALLAVQDLGSAAAGALEPPPPVVVDAPGLQDGARPGSGRRELVRRRTAKMLVGGLLFVGLLWLGGGGGIAGTRPF